MIFALYCYGESKPSDNEDDRHINRVEEEKEDREYENIELIEPINQYITPSTPRFQVINIYNQ